MSYIKENRGFSSVELMIALTLMCVVIGFGFLSTTTLQARRHDAKRLQDIDVLHKNIESHFAKKAVYPTLGNMNDLSWLKDNLPSLDTASLRDPRGVTQKLADTPTGNQYSYDVSAADGGPCDNVVAQCKKYSLTTIKEESGSYYSKGNIN